MTDEPVTEEELMRARLQVPPHVVFRTFPSETVLLNLKTGNYHGLNTTAGRMLELLQESGSALAAAQAVADEYDQPLDVVTRDVAQLCTDLLDRGLLELATTPG